MQYSIRDAKTRLSKILAEVAKGHDVIITSGSSRKPIARILRIEEPVLPRIGFAEHWPELRLEFFDPLPEDELRL